MLNFAQNTAREAGKILLEKFGRKISVSDKSDKNIVTEADLASEKYIVEQINSHFPRHAILAEESGASLVESETEYRWIIDPLDGTTNFAHGYPCFCVSIGLEKIGEGIQIGAIYDPTRDEMFAAEKGRGATLNGRPIRVSEIEDLNRALLVTGFPYDVQKRERFVELFGKFVLNAQAVRRDGSAAIDLAYIACGRFDGFWEEYSGSQLSQIKSDTYEYSEKESGHLVSTSLSDGLKEWDVAAGTLIVEEAGGEILNQYGQPLDFKAKNQTLIATNKLISQQMIEVIREY